MSEFAVWLTAQRNSRNWTQDDVAERKIEQASAVRALIEFLLDLEPEHQLMVLGQLPGREDLAKMLLRRMAGTGKRRR